ncbi:hypothetical protein Agub_g11827, partial [Astrephomene gubernaculifera]
LGLREACRTSGRLGGVLLLVEPAVSDVALVEQLLEEVWSGPAAVLLNPQWGQLQGGAGGQGQSAPPQLPPEYQRLAESVEVRYSLLLCAIQGLLGRKEGAVLLTSADPPGPSAAPRGAPWRILLRQGEEFVQVGAMPRRPSSGDLELAFLNASAAASPLTKTAKFLRGLLPGKK